MAMTFWLCFGCGSFLMDGPLGGLWGRRVGEYNILTVSSVCISCIVITV